MREDFIAHKRHLQEGTLAFLFSCREQFLFLYENFQNFRSSCKLCFLKTLFQIFKKNTFLEQF